MLHRGPFPPQRKLHTCHSSISGTWGTLGNVPKLLGTSSRTWGFAGRPQDIPGRFQGHSGQILGRFQADFRSVLGRFWGYSGHISLVLTMDIDHCTI